MRHHDHHAAHSHDESTGSLNQLALQATVHCLSGCAIGEVLGMVLGTALDWSNGTTVIVSIVLAFLSGYALTMRPLLQAGFEWHVAGRLALAADSASIAVMEAVDSLVMLLIPGAMDATLASLLFWGSLVTSLLVAGVAAYPVNRWLIQRGRGHAVVHAHHGAA
ncbi:MAG: DUF4396 domain-containing protein [Methylotetracoccus sp.]